MRTATPSSFLRFDWKGTWAAGIYFRDILAEQLNKMSEQYYVYHWVDSGDGTPQADEIQLETFGSP